MLGRAYRRHTQEKHFQRRKRNYAARIRREIDETVKIHFLKTTGKPCSCYMCSGFKKYNRNDHGVQVGTDT